MEINTTDMRFFELPPLHFFSIIGIVFATSTFVLLLLKCNYSVTRYSKIFMFGGIGMLIGARLFGALSSIYNAIGTGEVIGISVLTNTGIVFYGGMAGFVFVFILICKIWNKNIELGVIDLVAVCIPLFHFWGRLGCFFAGCCYGIESDSVISILYTNFINHQIVTASRIPVQLIEAIVNLVIFVVLFILLSMKKLHGHLIIVYLSLYATVRIFLELLRGDEMRGVWGGVSFGQAVSVVILFCCALYIIKYRINKSRKVSL